MAMMKETDHPAISVCVTCGELAVGTVEDLDPLRWSIQHTRENAGHVANTFGSKK